jgi:hypothetical protein
MSDTTEPDKVPPAPSDTLAVVNWGNKLQLVNGTVLQYTSVDSRSTDNWIILVGVYAQMVTNYKAVQNVPYVVVQASQITGVWQV